MKDVFFKVVTSIFLGVVFWGIGIDQKVDASTDFTLSPYVVGDNSLSGYCSSGVKNATIISFTDPNGTNLETLCVDGKNCQIDPKGHLNINLNAYPNLKGQLVMFAGDYVNVNYFIGTTLISKTNMEIDFPGTIRINYVDRDSNQEISRDRIIGGVDKFAKKDIQNKVAAKVSELVEEGCNYESMSWDLGGHIKDDFKYQRNSQTVTVYLKKKIITKCKIIVRYKDEDTQKEISTPRILLGNFNDKYNVTSKSYQPTISGYKLDRSNLPSNKKGIFTKEIEEVIYYYKINK